MNPAGPARHNRRQGGSSVTGCMASTMSGSHECRWRLVAARVKGGACWRRHDALRAEHTCATRSALPCPPACGQLACLVAPTRSASDGSAPGRGTTRKPLPISWPVRLNSRTRSSSTLANPESSLAMRMSWVLAASSHASAHARSVPARRCGMHAAIEQGSNAELPGLCTKSPAQTKGCRPGQVCTAASCAGAHGRHRPGTTERGPGCGAGTCRHSSGLAACGQRP